MTREEAIKRLSKYVNNGFYTIEHQETCAMAIAALREQGGSFQNGNDHNTVKDWPPYLDLPRGQENVTKCHDLYDEDGGEILAQESLEKKTSDSKTSDKKTSDPCPWCKRGWDWDVIDGDFGQYVHHSIIKHCFHCGRRLEDV